MCLERRRMERSATARGLSTSSRSDLSADGIQASVVRSRWQSSSPRPVLVMCSQQEASAAFAGVGANHALTTSASTTRNPNSHMPNKGRQQGAWSGRARRRKERPAKEDQPAWTQRFSGPAHPRAVGMPHSPCPPAPAVPLAQAPSGSPRSERRYRGKG
jgi:hypothetical protein